MSIESIPVSSFMTKSVKTEVEDQNIQAVCKIMSEGNIGSVIIIKTSDGSSGGNSSKPVGIITERDVVRIIGMFKPNLLQIPLRDLMSKPLIVISPNSSIKDAIQTMQVNNIRRLPIVEKENMKGIITDKDVLKAILNNQISINNLVGDNSLLGLSRGVFDQYRERFFSDDFIQRR